MSTPLANAVARNVDGPNAVVSSVGEAQVPIVAQGKGHGRLFGGVGDGLDGGICGTWNG